MLIFVYGTLKRGGANHRWLAGHRFVGEAVTVPGFCLYELEGYPGMVVEPGSNVAVQGEVWEVDDDGLAGLDELEDIAGGEYVRERIPLAPPFELQPVQGYRYLRSVAGKRRLGPLWAASNAVA